MTSGRALRVEAKAPDIEHLSLPIVALERLAPGPGECVIEIAAAAINPSDVKACFGGMPQAIWPRTPGRDFAGILREGPAALIGREVFGSGGELGISRDGTHATQLRLSPGHFATKPRNLSLEEAAGLGVPFVTAALGLEGAGIKPGDVLLVLGANGKVGQAAVQLGSRAGARVFAVERKGEGYRGHATGAVEALDARRVSIPEFLRDKTAGHGADIVFNTVGSPYFEAANQAMAHAGRQIFISTVERKVGFDIFAFYRGEHRYIGVDSLGHDSRRGAELLEALVPGFEDGSLRPFPIEATQVYPLERALDAYRAVLVGSQQRLLLRPAAASAKRETLK
jgi:NADPH:quinone reductase-like Zn-dependent oxidoreductase